MIIKNAVNETSPNRKWCQQLAIFSHTQPVIHLYYDAMYRIIITDNFWYFHLDQATVNYTQPVEELCYFCRKFTEVKQSVVHEVFFEHLFTLFMFILKIGAKKWDSWWHFIIIQRAINYRWQTGVYRKPPPRLYSQTIVFRLHAAGTYFSLF